MTEKYVLEQPNGQFFRSLMVSEGVYIWSQLDPDPRHAKKFNNLKNAKKFAKHNLHVKWSIVKLSDARMDDFWKQSNP